MRKMLLAVGFMVIGALFVAPSLHATSLKIAPLEYRTTLEKGEKKKGFIDVSNPSEQTVRVEASVQAFRQVDDNGSLQFFDSEQLSAGVRLDLDEFELGPREAIRMYFLLDGARLPSGDVFGAIFFTTSPTDKSSGIGQAVRLGTLLSVVNGTAGPRDAKITSLEVPWLQLGDTVTGTYRIKNTADPSSATGFYPTVQLRAAPFGEAKKQTGKLAFAGVTRTNEFSLDVFPLGVYQVSAGYQGSKQTSWVVVASPAAIIGVVALASLCVVAWRQYGKYRARKRRNLQA